MTVFNSFFLETLFSFVLLFCFCYGKMCVCVCVCVCWGRYGPSVLHSLVLLALLSVIFDYCSRNWHDIGLLDCGFPWRGSWRVGVFRLSWSWSLVACEGCWGLLVIHKYENKKAFKEELLRSWLGLCGSFHFVVFISLFIWLYFFALHTER